MDVLYIVMPAYNEEENLKNVIEEWYPIVEKYNGHGLSRLVIVNDGSKDNTLKVGKSLEEGRPLLEVLDKKNSGHGATVLYAYEYALSKNADYIFQTDSDGQTRPDEFEQFWLKREEKEAIIGYRNHREDGVSRVFVTKVLKLVLLAIFRMNIPDANTPFRLMNQRILKEYISDVPPAFNLSNVMLCVLFKYNKENIEFIPITFRQRQGGVNSINLKKITKIGLKACEDFRTIKKGMKKHHKITVNQEKQDNILTDVKIATISKED